MALVIAVEDVESKKSGTFVFTRSPVHVGRSELNDLCLPVPFVSLFHGVVRFEGKDILYVDTGSRNGTELGGERMRNGVATPVTAGATVAIGTLRFRFSLDANAAPVSAEAVRRSLFGEQRERLDAMAGGTRVLAPVPRLEEQPMRTQLAAVLSEIAGSGEPSADRTIIDARPIPLDTAAAPEPVVVTPAPPAPEPIVRTEGVKRLVGGISNDYAAYRSSFSAMLKSVESGISGLSPAERRSAFVLLGARYPALLQEKQFRELAESHGYSGPKPSTTSEPGSGSNVILSDSLRPIAEPAEPGRPRDVAALKALSAFAQAYAPATPALQTGSDVAQFLDRVAQVLETFAKAFVELRKGQAQFGEEMAVRLGDDGTPLGRARNLQEVLSYLLEQNKETFVRVEHLTRAFADIMIHQVALLSGTREGAKELLAQLSPEALEREGTGRRGKSSLGEKLFGRKNLWERFVERHGELLEDEQQLTQALFGRKFARAYTAVAGGSFDGDGEDRS